MLNVLLRNYKLILIWTLVVGVLSLGASMLFPKKYSADSQVLIISRDRSGVDPYTQAKSAMQVGQNLAEVMLTTDFYDKVISQTSAGFDKEKWQNMTERERRKQWAKDVVPEMQYNTSILNIKVFSKDKADAVAFSQAVTDTLTSRGWEYVGGDIALKAVSSPLVSRWQARPNLIVNSAVGLLVGLLLSILWVIRYKKSASFGRV